MKKLFISLLLLLMMTTQCFAQNCEVSIDGNSICDFKITDWYGLSSAPALSSVGTARVYFDFASGKLKCSEDGNAYANCVGSGGGGSGNVQNGTLNIVPVYVGISTVGPSSNVYIVGQNVGIGTSIPSAGLSVMSGSVGIGTWKPDISGLEISGKTSTIDDTVFPVLRIKNLQGTTATTASLEIVAGSQSADFRVDGLGTGSYATKNLAIDTGGASTMPIIMATGGTERIRISNAGITFKDFINLVFGTINGTKIGTATNQLLAFYGSTPVTQQSGDVATALSTLGLVSSPTIASAGGWTDGGTNVFVSTTTDVVGIGTTTPLATLEVENVGAGNSFRVNDSLLDSSPFIIAPDGNVGIGTTAPINSKLDVVGGSITNEKTSNGYFTSLGFNGNDPFLTYYSAAGLTLGYGAVTGGAPTVNTMTLTNAGNVGIGTTTPLGGLTVMNGNVGIGTWSPAAGLVVMNGNAGIGVASPIASLEVYKSLGSTSLGGSELLRLSTDVDGNVLGRRSELGFGLSTYNPEALIGAIKMNTGGYGYSDLYFATRAAAIDTAPLERMRITSDGNVGIGTTTPSDRLTIGGSNTASVRFLSAGSGGNSLNWYLTDDTTRRAYINFNDGSGMFDFVSVRSGNPDYRMRFFTGNTERMQINNSGNVGIGTTLPGALLDVAGVVRIGAGSVSAPSLTFSGDNNTGIYSPAPDNLNIATNGVRAVSIGSGGDVGMLSSRKLTMDSDQDGFTFLESDLNNAFGYQNASFIFGSAQGNFAFTDGEDTSTPVMVMQVGNVGIGTTFPSTRLEINAGHIRSTGSAPTVASNDCGTTSQGTVTVKSTDVKGSFTVGTLTVTSCAITFSVAYHVAPTCITQDDSNILGIKTTTTTTKMTTTSTTSMSGDVISYICFE